uniref:Uncharacterized protein n=1 Tax=Zea mays TaxID=4577 RepID=A0A804LM95_MAIZE
KIPKTTAAPPPPPCLCHTGTSSSSFPLSSFSLSPPPPPYPSPPRLSSQSPRIRRPPSTSRTRDPSPVAVPPGPTARVFSSKAAPPASATRLASSTRFDSAPTPPAPTASSSASTEMPQWGHASAPRPNGRKCPRAGSGCRSSHHTTTGFLISECLLTLREFLLHRVVFFVVGLVLMVVAHTLSESVVFYYGGAMTIGIFLVILIILFQGMKLLPTGRKSSLAIFAYSSVVGMTTYFLHYLSGMLRSVLVEIGIAEDMHNPLGIFALVCVVLAGAWFGYWGVRKLVLAEDGSVDEGVAYFVEWAILIVSAVMILQSSLDYLFAFAALIFCVIIKAIARIEGKSKVLHYIFGNSSRYGDFFEDYSSMNGGRQDGKLHGGYQRRTESRNSPLAASPGSAKSLSQGVARDSFYSTFHTTPERRKFSKEEYEAFTREETKKAMKQLLSSPDFNRWALANADRISVAPPGGNYSSSNSNQQRHRFLGLF